MIQFRQVENLGVEKLRSCSPGTLKFQPGSGWSCRGLSVTSRFTCKLNCSHGSLWPGPLQLLLEWHDGIIAGFLQSDLPSERKTSHNLSNPFNVIFCLLGNTLVTHQPCPTRALDRRRITGQLFWKPALLFSNMEIKIMFKEYRIFWDLKGFIILSLFWFSLSYIMVVVYIINLTFP